MDPIVEIRYGNGSSGKVVWTEGGNRELIITIPIPRGLDADGFVLEDMIRKVHGASLAMWRELSGMTSGSPVARKTIRDMCFDRLCGRGFSRNKTAMIANRITDPLIAWLGSKADT
jgi:hypothetical protein